MEKAITEERNDKLLDELVLEIQLRLPPKSLFKFKCVSNSWCNLISSPSFKEMHDKQSKKNPNLLFCQNAIYRRSGQGAEWKSFNPKSLSLCNTFVTTRCKVFNMMVTCFGVVCFLGTMDGIETQTFLYSIGTKELLALPIDSLSGFSRGPIVGLGVGYLSSTKKYKVALLFLKNNQLTHPFPHFKCQVIEISNSSGDGSTSYSNLNLSGNGGKSYSNWRVVEEDLPHLVDCFHPPILIEDTLYWNTWNKDLVVSFDVKNEKFGAINYPNQDNLEVITKNMYLVDLQGKLGLAKASSTNDCFNMVIWKLEDQSQSIWKKGYTVSLGEIKKDCLDLIRPIYLQGNEMILYNEQGCLVFYNLKRNTHKIVDVPAGFSPVGMCHESLLSIGTM